MEPNLPPSFRTMDASKPPETLESLSWWNDPEEQRILDAQTPEAQSVIRAMNVRPSIYAATKKVEGQAPESGSAMSLGDIIKRIAAA